MPNAASLPGVRGAPFWTWLAVAWALASPASALDPRKSISQFTHTAWTAQDGIAGPVRAIAQTPDGYLWLGTEAGLYRFDGLRFALWEPAQGEALPSSSVWSLCAAREGSLWIGLGSGGISRLRDGRLRSYSPRDGAPAGGLLSIVEDLDGAIWAGGQYGLGKFAAGRWSRIGAESGYPAPGAQSLLVDRRGDLWAATNGSNFGLSADPVRRNTILTLGRHAHGFTPTGEAVGMVWSMAEDPNGEVWIADTNGHSIRPIGSRSRPRAGVAAGAETMSLLLDGDGSLWIGLIEGGIRRLADFRQSPGSFLDRFEAADGLSGGLVYSTLLDREGNIWFGTAGGLDRFRDNKVMAFSAREGLDPDQQIALTSGGDGTVWIVSYTRDAVRRLERGRFVASKLPPYSPNDTPRILSLHADRNGRLFVGGSFRLAAQVDGRLSYVHAAEIEQGANVEAITTDAAGGLWLALTGWGAGPGADSVGRLLRYSQGAWFDYRDRSQIPAYRCRVAYGDARGGVWLGFENGEVVEHADGAFRRYSSADGLPAGRVLAITSDRAGRILIGGEGGLSRFAAGRFVTITKKNGLPGNSLSAIVEDEDGFLWLAGALGILRVSQAELERALRDPSYVMRGVTFDAGDGLRGLPRQREPFPTAARAADGKLWFATTGGVAVIDPRHWPSNAVPPTVLVEEIVADDRQLRAASGVELPPGTRNLKIRFAALSLTAPDRVRFRYRLDGYDDEWHGPVATRTVSYTNLPPRHYRFRVAACNDDGVWNEAGATLAFAILPAFHQTRGFQALLVAVMGAVAWTAYRWRVRQVTARLDRQFEERLSERTRIARELHDTLLQGFLSASMQLHVAIDDLPAEAVARSRLDRVQQLMARVIEEARGALRGLRSPDRAADDLGQSLSRVRNELGTREAVAFRVIAEGPVRPLRPIIRDEVYRIGREAVVNAFRHAGAQSIEVELEYGSRQLRLLVRDDGKGTDPDVLRSGLEGHWGLSGMRERAEEIGARLRLWSRRGAGTEVELAVPGRIAFDGASAAGPWWWWTTLLSRRKRRGRGGGEPARGGRD